MIRINLSLLFYVGGTVFSYVIVYIHRKHVCGGHVGGTFHSQEDTFFCHHDKCTVESR